MKEEITINGQSCSFNGDVDDLATLLKQPKVLWNYKYVHASDGWLNIVSDGTKFYVGWNLFPRQFDDDWTWLNDHSFSVYDFDSLTDAIEYAKKY